MELVSIDPRILVVLLDNLVNENLFKSECINKKVESFDINNFNSYLENKEFCIHLNFDHIYNLSELATESYTYDLNISFTKGKIFILDNIDDSYKTFEIDTNKSILSLRKTFDEIEKLVYINKNALFQILKVMENI